MKCPSSKAPAARNSPRMSSSVMGCSSSAGCVEYGRRQAVATISETLRPARLEGRESRSYKAADFKALPAMAALPTTNPDTGVMMTVIGRAIALAAAGFSSTAAWARTAPATAPAATTANAAAAAPAAAPPVDYVTPTPGIGMPDGRLGLQDQVTALGQRVANFHNGPLLWMCAIISVFVLALLLYAIFRFRRGANPTPSKTAHNTLIEVVW